jgi:hypothetical protein
MKSFLSTFFLFFCLSGLLAQEKHFVFIQSDNNLPFYVSLNGKLLSSTATGYVIIPKLTNGDYNFSIGFAKNAFPEQGFQVVIDNKDLGFNLKNFGEKGWGLFNLQSFNVTMAGSTSSNDVANAINEKVAPKDDDEPLISFNKKKKTIPAETKAKADAVANEQVTTNENPEGREAKPGNDITKEDRVDTNSVKKVSEIKDGEGVHLSYSDNNGKATDTIHVTIPSVNSENTENTASPSETGGADSNSASPTKPDISANAAAANDTLKFLDLKTDKSKKDEADQVTANNNASAVTNSKCKSVAGDEDYTRLRRKMAMQTTDEKMINEAKKMYRNKCFTTSQIKKLSTLFLSDEGRYNFFNASYNSAADISEYGTLQSEFIDPAFANRFKAMLQ